MNAIAYIVGLCGIDGSGKTTVAQLVVRELLARGLKVHYRHELDLPLLKGLLGLARLLMGGKRASGLRDTVLVTKERNSPFVSFVYHLVAWFDSIVALALFKVRPGVVVHDRWPYDFLLQFQLRDYDNSLIKTLFARFPRPDTLVLLRVSPEAAFERKQGDPSHLHDSVEFFRRSTELMDELEKRCRYDAVISTEVSAREVAQQVLRVVDQRMQ